GQDAHTLLVSGAAAPANPGPASRRWAVATTAPVVSVSPVSSPARSPSASIDFSVTGGAASVVCKLDAAAAAACSSPFTASGLGEGEHTLLVSATDAAGNSGSASRSWVIDTTAPVVTVSPVSSPTRSTSVSVDFSVAGGSASVVCKLDSGVAAACSSPFTASGLGEGEHTLLVSATDAAGNTG